MLTDGIFPTCHLEGSFGVKSAASEDGAAESACNYVTDKLLMSSATKALNRH